MVECADEAALHARGAPALVSLGRALLLTADVAGRAALYHTRAGWTRQAPPLGAGLVRASALLLASMCVEEREVSWLLAVGEAEPRDGDGSDSSSGALLLWRLSLAHPTHEAPDESAIGLVPLLKVGLPSPPVCVGGDDVASLALTADGSVWHVGWAKGLDQVCVCVCACVRARAVACARLPGWRSSPATLCPAGAYSRVCSSARLALIARDPLPGWRVQSRVLVCPAGAHRRSARVAPAFTLARYRRARSPACRAARRGPSTSLRSARAATCSLARSAMQVRQYGG